MAKTSEARASGVGLAVVTAFLRVIGSSVANSATFLRDNCWSAYSASSRTLHALNRPEVRIILRKRWSCQSALLLQLVAWSARTVARNVRCSARSAKTRWNAAMHTMLMDTAMYLMGANAPLPAIEFDDKGFFDEFNDMLEPNQQPMALKMKRPRFAATTRSQDGADGEEEFELLPSYSENPAFYEPRHLNQDKLVCVKKARTTTTATNTAQTLSEQVADPLATPMCLESYLCGCGECPQYDTIARDVDEYATWLGSSEKKQATRLLQALSTYSEEIEYSRDMVVAAEECLQVWEGDEDRAFKSMAVLYDEFPRLCAGSA